MPDPAVLIAHGEARGKAYLDRLRGLRPRFVCVIASTETALIPGISAAGASPDLIPYTAAADAELIVHGAARCIAGVPSNPLGPPGPALITRAALELAGIEALVVDAGCRVRPDAPTIVLGEAPGGVLGDDEVVVDPHRLFARGHALGRELARDTDYVVVGESVPGGTTTALALLRALGIRADGRVSSSMAANAHDLKSAVAAKALARLHANAASRDPIGAIRIVGDPMQPVAAGIAAGVMAEGLPVLLAGGTQMIAVAALLGRLVALGTCPDFQGSLAVGTTRWVAEDPTADAPGLMREVGEEPLLASGLSFAASPHPGLRRYEEYLVKEGVGAGGAAIAAALAADVTTDRLQRAVETLYERILVLVR